MAATRSIAPLPAALNIAGRLDRLPMSTFHIRVMLCLAFAFFFELGDLNEFAYAAPALIKNMGLNVDDIARVSSGSFLGMFIGSVLGGRLSDAVGRRPALIASVIFYSVFSLSNALGRNVAELFIARVLTGVGLSAMTVMAITYLAELVPKDRRGRMQSATLGIGLLGIPGTAFFARAVIPMGPDGWRWIFVFGALGVLFVALVPLLPESPRWLAIRGRTAEAQAVLEKIEAEVSAQVGTLPRPQECFTVDTHATDVRTLFRGVLAKRTAMLWIAWAFQTLGFYGFMVSAKEPPRVFEPDFRQEADRQLTLCNACRYCEGFCAVFPATELRTSFEPGDIAYLANVCHDCRMCYDACPFAPPHEFAINIPALLADARVRTYEHYSKPPAFARLFRVPQAGALIIGVVAFVAIAAAMLLYVGPVALFSPHLGPGAFYQVAPYRAIVIPALAITLYGIAVQANGARQFLRDMRADPREMLNWRILVKGTCAAFSLVYWRGGGAGCYDERRGSQARRILHFFVFWGFMAALASTTLAYVYGDWLGRLPPYPLTSLPVVLGILGGAGITIGATGMLWRKGKSDSVPTSPQMVAMDAAFIVLLDVVALTGLLLLALRSTGVMGLLLALHLGAVAALFVTAPYGKLVHGFYRYLALIQNAAEQQRVAGESVKR